VRHSRIAISISTALNDISVQNQPAQRYLIHWRGEHKQQYSQSFRQVEFLSALSATASESPSGLGVSDIVTSLKDRAIFTNAFLYDPYKQIDNQLPPTVSLCHVKMYNNALQYLDIKCDAGLTTESIKRATEQCSLIHSTYIVLAQSSSYAKLVDKSLLSKTFKDMIQFLELRQLGAYGAMSPALLVVDDDNPRFGKRGTWSVLKERATLAHLEPLFTQLGGRVDLQNPECNIYLLGGGCHLLRKQVAC
jgi:hypothetical protein